MYCPSCGNPVNDKARFCPKCGATLRTVEPARQATPPHKDGARRKMLPLVLSIVAIAVIAFVCMRVVVPLISSLRNGGTNTTQTSTNLVANEGEADGDNSSQNQNTSVSQNHGEGTIERDIWDTSSVAFSNSTLERDIYGRTIIRTTATNDSDNYAIVQIKAELELTNLSDNFKRLSDIADGYKTEYDFMVKEIIKTDGSLSIDCDVLRLDPHESAQLTLYGYSKDMNGVGEGLVYGTDFELALKSIEATDVLRPSPAFSNAETIMSKYGLCSLESDVDNEEVFRSFLDDISCELISSEATPTKDAGVLRVTAVVRVKNSSDTKRGVFLRLGCFDEKDNYLFSSADGNGRLWDDDESWFGASQRKLEDGMVVWMYTDEGGKSEGGVWPAVDVTTSEGGSHWGTRLSRFGNEAGYGGDVTANAEIDVTISSTVWSKTRAFTGNETVRILSMMPIAEDLDLEALGKE